MPHAPLVSVVIPAYQSERTLGAAVSSALNQTYPRVEVVVCLDGPTDRSADIAAAYGDLVTVVAQENAGVAAARNAAVAASSGELVALLDADDELLPPHLERAVDAWSARGGADGRAYVTCNAFAVGSAGLVPRRTVLPARLPGGTAHRLALLQRNIVSIMSVYPRAMHDELGGFDPAMRVLEDYDLWLRAAFAGWETIYQPTPSALYRRGEGSLSDGLDRMAEYERRMRAGIRERYADRLTDVERAYLDTAASMETCDVHLARGDEALRAGRAREAAREYAAASALVPFDTPLRLKARALASLPGAGHVYAWRERLRRAETSRT